MFLEYILSFFAIWIGKIFTLVLNIIPVGWVLYILHSFDINFNLQNSIDLYILFFVCFLAFIIISKKLFEVIYLTFFKTADGISLIGMFLKWLVGLISFKKLGEAMNFRKNAFSFMFSLFVIILIYNLSYKGITTFSDLIDYTYNKTDAKTITFKKESFSEKLKNEKNEKTAQLLSGNNLSGNNLSGNNLSGTQTTFSSGEMFSFNFNGTGKLLTGNFMNNFGKYLVYYTYQTKHGFNVAKKRISGLDINKLLMSGDNQDILQTKEQYQKLYFLLTLQLDKQPNYLKTYEFLGFPFEPITFNKSTNFLYLIFVSLLVLSFWIMIIAISPLLDIALIIFVRRTFDYWDIASMILRAIFAVWLYYNIFI